VAVRVAEMNVDNTHDLTSKGSRRTELPIVLDETAVEDILGVILVLFNIYTFLVELSALDSIVT
jgi:succinate-acetate transporter protein